MDSERSPFDILHSASPPFDFAHDVMTLAVDILFREPFDLRYLHVEVV